MKCLGFLTEENLRQEANQYGAAGGRPQVVWANGILASLAVGILVDMATLGMATLAGKTPIPARVDWANANRLTRHQVRNREIYCPPISLFRWWARRP